MLGEGHADREIAAILSIGVRTVEFHVANILRKPGVDNRRDARALGARLRLIGDRSAQRRQTRSSGRVAALA